MINDIIPTSALPRLATSAAAGCLRRLARQRAAGASAGELHRGPGRTPLVGHT